MEKVAETSELSGLGADDSCDEEVYVPTIPQRHLYVFDQAHFQDWGSVHRSSHKDFMLDAQFLNPDSASLHVASVTTLSK